ncbi:hypothetical protein RRG08_041945 [Elysia crispata]|uniref:Uncharacterized protein n=1 Tax=Elysia crispata TaxID=231223 RepID=A0AAE0XX06_9GAST|nr:hypothetical protein RRG08_041945 [Elysia crispata]
MEAQSPVSNNWMFGTHTGRVQTSYGHVLSAPLRLATGVRSNPANNRPRQSSNLLMGGNPVWFPNSGVDGSRACRVLWHGPARGSPSVLVLGQPVSILLELVPQGLFVPFVATPMLSG